jgi:Ca-activated chloride channel family protein
MEVFRFGSIEYLWGLLIIPLLIVFFVWSRISRKKALKKFGQEETLSQLMPYSSKNRPVVKFGILMLALAFFIVGLARPQFGSKLKTEKRKGIELMIALDVSNSMMAADIQPNRLERAKRAISRLIDRLKDDKIGLIVFAGDAYTQLPITSDYSSAKLFLNSVNTQIVPKQGTAIGAAIDLAHHSFTPNGEANKAIIVITDGENHEDDAVGAAQSCVDDGIIVHTIGMGLPSGSPIPVQKNGQTDYLKDKEGNVVITKLNEQMLEEISAAGTGIYVRANNAQVGLNTLFDEINKMEKQEMETRTFSEYNDQFQYFFAAGLLLLLLEFIILERKNKYLKDIKMFG